MLTNRRIHGGDMRIEHRRSPRAAGFTILEMAIALIAAGLITGALVGVFNQLSRTPEAALSATTDQLQLSAAERSIAGYALSTFHFPTPVGSTNMNVPGLVSGQVDPNQVGLPPSPPVQYAVDSRLLNLLTYEPDPDNLAQGQLPARQVPGLPDLCYTLAAIARQPAASLSGVPVAIVLGVTGTSGSIVPPQPLPLPGSPQALSLAAQGLSLDALGAGQLYGHFGCPKLLATVAAQAKAVGAAVDMQTWAATLVGFRQLQVAEDIQADVSLAIKLAISAAVLTTLQADLDSSSVQTALATPDARTFASAANLAAAYGGLEVIIGYIAFYIVQIQSLIADLEAVPSAVASAQQALAQANDLAASANAALSAAQNRYSWSLLGI